MYLYTPACRSPEKLGEHKHESILKYVACLQGPRETRAGEYARPLAELSRFVPGAKNVVRANKCRGLHHPLEESDSIYLEELSCGLSQADDRKGYLFDIMNNACAKREHTPDNLHRRQPYPRRDNLEHQIICPQST